MAEQDLRRPEVNEILIYSRNERWLPRIEEYLHSDRSHLVVVGATHLAGERGILRALGDKGYNIRQL
jgi:uncharacterized protein YbaP (TraB family)